jgi:hypothetical protein
MKTQENKAEQLAEMMYQDSLIHFAFTKSNKDVMVNATEMAKIFGKRTGNFLANKETKDTIKALERTGMSVHSDSKIVDDRGHMGIYFHRLLAIDFASWLDKDFKVWTLLTIEKVLFGKIDVVKNSINNIKSAEQVLKDAIEKAKRDGNKDAIAIIDAYNAKELAKSNKTKAIKLFSKQISMDL